MKRFLILPIVFLSISNLSYAQDSAVCEGKVNFMHREEMARVQKMLNSGDHEEKMRAQTEQMRLQLEIQGEKALCKEKAKIDPNEEGDPDEEL